MAQLYSFTPNGGSEYVLPLITDDQRSLQMASGMIVPVSEAWGSISGVGAGALNPVAAIFQLRLEFTPNALIARGYTGDLAGLETAKIDLANVFAAGEGSLKELLPTGTKNGKAGSTITYRTTTVVASGTPTGSSESQSDVWALDITLTSRSCYWRDNLGNFTPMWGF